MDLTWPLAEKALDHVCITEKGHVLLWNKKLFLAASGPLYKVPGIQSNPTMSI